MCKFFIHVLWLFATNLTCVTGVHIMEEGRHTSGGDGPDR